MLTWFRNRWPDPRIAERELEIQRLLDVHYLDGKEWAKRVDKTQLAAADYWLGRVDVERRKVDKAEAALQAAEGRALLAESELYTRKPVEKLVEVPKPVYIDKIVPVEKLVTVEKIVEKIIVKATDDVREENRVLAKRLEIAIGKLHMFDHNAAIAIMKTKPEHLR